ncbi:cyclic AMP-dependent transcription factor ATF-1-like isoform X1 [Scomber japonicus]|uniref:cyclic AMP-dependent transcription factor ATF-1-like isoform X1 n=1 Tax=Scomber japonicus TaxID=13676 RepID=UPI002305621C|nr:cyclic AMP-dependent transcription factor ATF-1-like isoform X1 [Scomber japonicus]
MNRAKKGGKNQLCAPQPYTQVPVYHPGQNQHYGYIQRSPMNFMPEGIERSQQPSPNTFHYYEETARCQQHFCVSTLPEGPVQFQPGVTQNLPPMPGTHPYYNENVDVPQMHSNPTLSASTGDLTACQLRNSSSSLLQAAVESSPRSSQKPMGDSVQKRELRLMRNREAARECRRKKKEYVKCLENRVDVLENQNKTLIEELRALKDIYRHKAE